MANDDFLKYPKGRVSLGSGDLQQATDITVRASKGRKLVSTLRNNPAGSTDGEATSEVTAKSVIDENGFERDWWSKWEKGETVQIRVKVPGKTFAVTGVLEDLEVTSNVGGAIEFSFKVMGKLKVS